MIFSKATWIAVTLMCQVSFKTKETEYCTLDFTGVFKSNQECERRKKSSEKCIEFKSGEFLIMYKGMKK